MAQQNPYISVDELKILFNESILYEIDIIKPIMDKSKSASQEDSDIELSDGSTLASSADIDIDITKIYQNFFIKSEFYEHVFEVKTYNKENDKN